VQRVGVAEKKFHPLEAVPDTTTTASTPISQAREWAEDLQLMQLAAARNPEAQEKVVLRVMTRTRTVCRSLLGPSADSADAVQSSIEEILKSAPRFRGESSLETWADRISVRVALRSGKRQKFWKQVLPWADDTAPPEPAPARQQSDGLPRPVQQYLDELPEDRREVLVLKYLLDYSVEGIAETLRLSPNTVKYRLKQALAQMRALIRREAAVGTARDR
jgi:RNA polymerase sigma factor (sigma-70 family)